jgi:hypothetical protein
MILEPRKTAQEIDERLSALNDPGLAELLVDLNRGFSSQEPANEGTESYTSPDAPYWKRRVGFVVLAGLFAMSAGYASIATASHPAAPRAKPKPHAALPAPLPRHAQPRIALAVHHAAAAAVPDEAQIRQARTQLLHESVLAAQARAQTAQAQQQARFAMEQAVMARSWAHAEAVAQARAEAKAEALARAQAESVAARAQAQDEVLQNASDPDIKPGDMPPSGTGRMPTYPSGGPLPAPGRMPGPIDTNCTPHRGSLFQTVINAAVSHEIQQLIH